MCTVSFADVDSAEVECIPCQAMMLQMSSISIYLSIYGIYVARLQDNYSEALPAQVICCP